ncbi:MAG: glycine cleavage system protein GcvH [Oscillospiraceae bacterium]|nr:glycine cleavage system protein GcvH [Oscillospiraceae bacterium]
MFIKFTQKHEWVKSEGKTAYIGISDFAQNALGDIVFVELPQTGAKLESGKAFGSVESVKAVSEIYAPVSGTVTEVNSELEDAPELLNADAYESWIVKIELDANSETELDSLMNEEEYGEFCKNES